jgi:hypothetical protein
MVVAVPTIHARSVVVADLSLIVSLTTGSAIIINGKTATDRETTHVRATRVRATHVRATRVRATRVRATRVRAETWMVSHDPKRKVRRLPVLIRGAPKVEVVNSSPISAIVTEIGATATEIGGRTVAGIVTATLTVTDHLVTNPFWSRSGAAKMSYDRVILNRVSRAWAN